MQGGRALARQSARLVSLFGAWVQRHHCKLTSQENVVVLDLLAGPGCFGDLQGYFHTASTGRISHSATVFEIADFRERRFDGDSIAGGCDGGDGTPGMLVRNDSRQGVQVHEESTEPDVTAGVCVSVQKPWILRQWKNLRGLYQLAAQWLFGAGRRPYDAVVAVCHSLGRQVTILVGRRLRPGRGCARVMAVLLFLLQRFDPGYLHTVLCQGAKYAVGLQS